MLNSWSIQSVIWIFTVMHMGQMFYYLHKDDGMGVFANGLLTVLGLVAIYQLYN